LAQPYPPQYPQQNSFPSPHPFDPSQYSHQQQPSFRQHWTESAQSLPHLQYPSQQTPTPYSHPPNNPSVVPSSSQHAPGHWNQPSSSSPLTSQQPTNTFPPPQPDHMSSYPSTHRTSPFVPGTYTPSSNTSARPYRTDTESSTLSNGYRTDTTRSTLSFDPADPRDVAERYGATAPDGSRFSTANPPQSTEKPNLLRRLFGSSKNTPSTQPLSPAESTAQQYEQALDSNLSVRDAMNMARNAYDPGSQNAYGQPSGKRSTVGPGRPR